MTVKTRVRLPFFLFIGAMTLAALPFPEARGAKPEFKIRVASAIPGSSSIWNVEIDKVMRRINSRSNGRVEARYYHSGKLGKESELLDQVRIGAIQVAGLTSSVLAALAPEVQIMELPYLFRDEDEAHDLVDRVIQPTIARKLREKGLIAAAFMENGFLQFLTPKRIDRPEDFKGLKIGSWESPLYLSFWKAMNAQAIPLPTTEIVTAYGQGLVDSGTNSVHAIAVVDPLFGPLIARPKYWIGVNNHIYQAGIVVMNEDAWKKLPPDIQTIIREEIDSLTHTLRTKLKSSEKNDLKKLKSRGYNVLIYDDRMNAPFIQRCEAVYKQYEKQIGGEFLEQVLQERKKRRKTLKNN